MKISELIKEIIPPLLLRWLGSYRYHRGRIIPEWEYVPGGWRTQTHDSAIKGWNVASVLEAYRSGWLEFLEKLEARHPFGMTNAAETSTITQLNAHNTMVSYAAAFILAARCKAKLSMLDWGGGIGQYYLISRSILPELDLEYHCKDFPILAEYGQRQIPQAHFYDDTSCLARRYDFVLASSSLHYSEDWIETFHGLAQAAADYLFVTRLPIVHRGDSYVFVQRPYRQGYNTEYLGWAIKRGALLDLADQSGFALVREFLIGERPRIHRAPEQCEYRGFLFRRRG